MLEDELTLAERFELGFHLASCPGCRAYLGPLVSAAEAVRASPESPPHESSPPAAMHAELLRELRRRDS